MARRLPPLNALRAFEAAARHLSFTLAADELFVTQAAVSHQVKNLEQHLGYALFRRLNRGLLLSEEGQTLFLTVRDSLNAIATTLERLGEHEAEGVLMVSTMDSLAATWLIPRMNRFRTLWPDIDVHLHTSDSVVDFSRENIDMAVRYGGGHWPGLRVDQLMTEEISPVCAPALLADGPPLNSPGDLRHYRLLHDDHHQDWRTWLAAAGATGVDHTKGEFYHHSNLVIQAAIGGQGVALGRSVLVAEALERGLLVRPFDISLPSNLAHYVVAPERTAERPKVKAFRDWLLAEARALDTPEMKAPEA